MVQSATHPARDLGLYVSLVDAAGVGQAGWEGWPLPAFPTTAWLEGQLAQLPVSLDLSAALEAGTYRLLAGFVDTATGAKSDPVTLAGFAVVRRPAGFTAPPSPYLLPAPIQFGTHVELIGYDVAAISTGLTITLTWHVLQPLLPSHHIFVHAADAAGQVIAQADGAPVTAQGRAPSGSWLPGEYLQTLHTLAPNGTDERAVELHVGLYLPATEVRLPAATQGRVFGDAAVLPLPAQP
jgi:hypothetical protein